MDRKTARKRVIEVKGHVIGPARPRPRTVRAKRIGDYPGVSKVHLEVARKLSSTLLMGPPICDESIALVEQLFTEEEAGVVRHLGLVRGRSAARLARAEHRPLEEIEPILHVLGFKKRVIAATGPDDDLRYRMLPLMPGIFEMVLISESPETMSAWHRRVAELFEALYETGYSTDYPGDTMRVGRALPVGKVIDAHPMALPSDRLGVILERFDTFAVGHCQCRTSAEVLGKGCGRPTEVCTVMGPWAELGIRDGWLKRISRQNVLQIKAEAESHGLVTWIMNVEATRIQSSCSCCGCCCKVFRAVTEFNAPGVIAPAHFTPRFDLASCTYCGRCATNCPLGAITVDTEQKTHRHARQRCIGCGLCVVACDGERAVAMEPVPDYKLPYRSWYSLITRSAPAAIINAFGAWRKRR